MMPHVNRRQRQRQRRTMMMMIMMMIMVMPPGQMQPQTVAYYAGYGYESVARDGFGFFPRARTNQPRRLLDTAQAQTGVPGFSGIFSVTPR